MVKNGIDCIGDYSKLFSGKRLGMITSVSGVDVRLQSSIQILHNQYGLSALFGPEHGVRGDKAAGEMVDTYNDPHTGVPVYSLYRKDSKRLTPEMLAGVDAVVYDIQDLGVRFYTFISTLIYAMEDCAANGKELIVLDRLDPLGGDVVEGNLLEPEYSSFVGAYPLPMRYGLTAGELATMVNHAQGIGCNLTVVPCQGWKRSQLFSDTGNLWMMPSLGIPRFDTAVIYAGTCIFEGTNLSEGRGTSCPFEIIGAPYIDGYQLSHHMNDKGVPGVLFTPAYFTPSTSKHSGVACQGVHLHVTDAHAYQSVRTGTALLYAVRSLYAQDFAFLPPVREGGRSFIQLLGGGDAYQQIEDEQALLKSFEADSANFAVYKQKFHLYE